MNCYNSAAIVNAGYITQPLFVAEALDDAIQLNNDGFPPPLSAWRASCPAYAGSFARAMTCLLLSASEAGCAGTGAGASNAIYAPYAHIHTMLDQDVAFHTAHVLGRRAARSYRSRARAGGYAFPCAPQKLVGVTPENTKLSDLLASISGGR